MSAEAARSWLSSHQGIIPALDIHHAQALNILEDHARTVRDLAEIVLRITGQLRGGGGLDAELIEQLRE